ncbi:MAG: hypothetical protein AAB249_03520, partial [Acidobacteriota bacterium]
QLKGVRQEVKVYCVTSHGLPVTDLSTVAAKLEPGERMGEAPLWRQPVAMACAAATLFIGLVAAWFLKPAPPATEPPLRRFALAVEPFPGRDYDGPAISPDGRLIGTAMTAGAPLIFPADGGEPRPVPGAAPGDIPSIWSSDGRSLFVVVRTSPGARVDRLDLATGRRTSVKTLMPADRAGLIDIAFVGLSADARSYVYSYRRVLSTLYLVDGLR